jgi:glycerophosphoryl diester phosphodiesterase
MHPFFRASGPLAFAHRGGARLAPENTIEAFDAGMRHGADGLELDVHLSRDGRVVVHHDTTLDRTTDRQGPIGRFTADELERVDAGYHFAADGSRPFRGQGIGIPTLDVVLARYRDTRIIIEMKQDEPQLAQATVEAVRTAGAADRVCLSSFGGRVLRTARELAPGIASGASRLEVRLALYRSRLRWPVRRPRYAGYQVPEISRGGHRVVSPRFVRHAHLASLPVQVWTIDGADDAERLLAWGVDALITDRPDVIVPIVRRGRGARAL